MTPLESKRLAALGHSDEQITAIKEYEQAVKKEMASTLRKVLVQNVPDPVYVSLSPTRIKQNIDGLIKDMSK